MKKYQVSDLSPGVSFDRSVFVNGKDVLLGAYQPLKKSDYERLKSWGVQYVTSEGELLDSDRAEEDLRELVSDIVGKESPELSDLYVISPQDTEDMKAAEKHQEVVEIIRTTFDQVRNNKNIDASELRNAASGLISFVNKNKRMIFKLLLMQPHDPKDFMYYNAVNTALLSILTGTTMKYSRLHLSNLALGAFLHDIGMTRISDDIVLKKGPLTEVERNILHKHPFYGYQVLRKANTFPNDVTVIVLQHHERLDGSGYPYGFKGGQISEYARITAICDTYQALCQKRQYRDAQSPPLIMKNLLQGELGKMDPNILKIFAYTVGVYPMGLMVKLTDGSVGEVILQNIKALAQPIVKLYIDENGQVSEGSEMLNLMMKESLEVARVLSNEERNEVLGRLGRK